MNYYKTTKLQYDIFSANWLQKYRTANPTDTITHNYCEGVCRGDDCYVEVDTVTMSYFEGAEIVAEIPPEHEWHFDLEIQVIFTYEENLRLLSEVPELALYVRNNDIPTVIENGHVYIYVNYLLPEHEAIMKKYGIINTKKTE
jgi:hypothetical protein